jgi:hypothetical protein
MVTRFFEKVVLLAAAVFKFNLAGMVKDKKNTYRRFLDDIR